MNLRRVAGPACLVLIPLALLVAPACSSDDDAASTSTSTSTSMPDYGSSMRPETVSVADIAALGPGPKIGDQWTGSIGLNVCGRFLEPLPSAAAAGGLSTDAAGRFAVAPTEQADTGDAAAIGKLAEQVGISLSTGSVTFPDSTLPTVIEDGTTRIPVAGQTFSTGDKCGDQPAEVQLWVYTKQAADTGEDVRQVVTDPQQVPIVEDGMSFVIAFSPASSLPTLPPSALAG